MYGQNNYSQYPYASYGLSPYGQRNYLQPQPQMPQAQMQQATMQTQQQQAPVQYDMPIQDIRFVTSKEAEAFIVMPNSRVLLIDKTGGMAYMKTADGMGQSVTNCYKFERVNADGTPMQPKEEKPKFDFEQFAKKEELNGYVTTEQYNDLFNKFNSMAEQFVAMKKQMALLKPLQGTKNEKVG